MTVVGPSDALAERLAAVRARVAAAGGDPRVVLVAVTKGHDRSVVEAAAAAGLHDLGESYAQELATKDLSG